MTQNTINSRGDFNPTTPSPVSISFAGQDATGIPASFVIDTKKLPTAKNIQDYNPEQTLTIQTALYTWLSKMPFYKGKTLTELFKRPGVCDGFTFNALKVFSRCYDLKFEGKLEAEHIAALENIANGTFADGCSPYRLKSPIAEKLYASACAGGVDKALEIKYNPKSRKSFCKSYKVGDKSDIFKIIKHQLNTWILKSSPKNDFRLDEASDIFDEKTYKILQLFNLRFGIPVQGNEITRDHLNVFKDLSNSDFCAEKYPLKKGPQSHIYALIQKHGIPNALAVYRREQSKKLTASRSGMFRNSLIGNFHILTDPGTSVAPELRLLFSSLANFLAQQQPAYHIIISSGRRNWGLSPAHPAGRAADFTVYIGRREITPTEAKSVAKLIRQFRTENNLHFKCLNEYGKENWYSSTTGDNFHIESW